VRYAFMLQDIHSQTREPPRLNLTHGFQ